VADDEDVVKDECLCCKLDTALIIWAVILWVLGCLIFLNICVMFANAYYPWWHPTAQFLLFALYFAALILIAVWCCKDNEASRAYMRLAGFLMLASTVLIMVWNIIYILCVQVIAPPA